MLARLNHIELSLLFNNNYKIAKGYTKEIQKELQNSNIQGFIGYLSKILKILQDNIIEKSIFCNYFIKILKIAGIKAEYKSSFEINDLKIYVNVNNTNYIFELFVDKANDIIKRNYHQKLTKIVKEDNLCVQINFESIGKKIDVFSIIRNDKKLNQLISKEYRVTFEKEDPSFEEIPVIAKKSVFDLLRNLLSKKT